MPQARNTSDDMTYSDLICNLASNPHTHKQQLRCIFATCTHILLVRSVMFTRTTEPLNATPPLLAPTRLPLITHLHEYMSTQLWAAGTMFGWLTLSPDRRLVPIICCKVRHMILGAIQFVGKYAEIFLKHHKKRH